MVPRFSLLSYMHGLALFHFNYTSNSFAKLPYFLVGSTSWFQLSLFWLLSFFHCKSYVQQESLLNKIASHQLIRQFVLLVDNSPSSSSFFFSLFFLL
jgi:hypothetical protein